MKIVRLKTVDSTNLEAFRLLDEEAHVIVLADEQTNGYGRNFSSWLSVKGNIHISIGKVTKATFIKNLSPKVVCKLFSILRNYVSGELKIKWPNDILLEGNKVAGILLESKIKGSVARIVLGIGINYSIAPVRDSGFLKDVISISKEELEDVLISSLANVFEEYSDSNQLLHCFNKHSYFKEGDLISLSSSGNLVKGVFKGYGRNFSLILETEKGVSFFYSGDVKKIRKN